MLHELQGQVALVTGGNRGIGRAITFELARRGLSVVVGVRNQEACDELTVALGAIGAQCWVTRCDVTNYTEVADAVSGAIERFGRLDALINNAGVIEPIGYLHEIDPADWAANINVNLLGVMHGCRAALPFFLEHASGVIVNISSGAAQRPLEGWSAYCAAKAGMAMLTRSLALEVGARGVHVYGLRPGVVDTEMQEIIRASGMNEVSRLQREDLVDPRVPAQVVAWLCIESAADLAGQELDVRDATLRQRVGLEPA